MRNALSNTFQKQITLTLDRPEFGDVVINGASAMRKYDEPDRSVISFVSRLAVAGTDLLFREDGWIVMSELTDATDRLASPPATVLQVYYRVFAEKDASSGGGSATSVTSASACTTYLHDFILRTLSQRMRVHHLEVQNTLLHELDAILSGRGLASRILTEYHV